MTLKFKLFVLACFIAMGLFLDSQSNAQCADDACDWDLYADLCLPCDWTITGNSFFCPGAKWNPETEDWESIVSICGSEIAIFETSCIAKCLPVSEPVIYRCARPDETDICVERETRYNAQCCNPNYSLDPNQWDPDKLQDCKAEIYEPVQTGCCLTGNPVLQEEEERPDCVDCDT